MGFGVGGRLGISFEIMGFVAFVYLLPEILRNRGSRRSPKFRVGLEDTKLKLKVVV